MNSKCILGVIIVGITLGASAILLQLQSADGARFRSTQNCPPEICGVDKAAPIATSGENVYMTWWTNNTANQNEEVMFRASTDAGTTFDDKMNLSNTTDSDSWNVEIGAEGTNVYVSWWETNQTHDVPVTRVSNDNGQTFGPVLNLATNGTIGETTEEEEGPEGE
jgi:hypothetical protein